MTILRHVILATHFIGLAAILTGWVVWRRTQVVEMLSVWGARIQILTGLALVGIAEALATEARPVNHAKVGVKLAIALAVVAVSEIANARARKRQGPTSIRSSPPGALTVVSVLGTLW
jgi:hypothetical protein